MDDRELRQRLLDMFHLNFRGQFRDERFAKETLEAIVKKISDISGLSITELCSFAQPVQNCTSIVNVQNCIDIEKEHVQNCTSNRELTGFEKIFGELPEVEYKYANSLSDETYEKIDSLLKVGVSIAEVSRQTGVHRNTISKRRKLLREEILGSENHV